MHRLTRLDVIDSPMVTRLARRSRLARRRRYLRCLGECLMGLVVALCASWWAVEWCRCLIP